MKSEVVLRALEKKDLRQVALVHIGAFPDSALTKLGPNVVEQFYLWQLTGPHKKVRATGAFVTDECAGFSFSGIFNGSTSGFLRQNRMLLIRGVLKHPTLLLDSLFLKRLKEGVKLLSRFARERPVSEVPVARTNLNYGILSIAVSPHFHKLGIGKSLMLDAEKEALNYGCREICLTVHPANMKAVRFYEGQNWQQLKTGDLWHGAMTKVLK